jgi:branched-chain amino acid transport system ATP-binding protein
MNALLELTGVTKRFGGLTALEGVSLSVAQGTIHAVIGPNGSGKTTLFNIISGIYTPTEGDVRFAAAVVTSKPLNQLAAMGLARTFQNTRLFASMTVRQNVLAARHGRAHPWRFDQENARRVEEIMQFVGLADVADTSAASLPQGQRRLLEIAKALALEPRLVLLDEPHGGLNHAETARLIEVIRQMHARGMTILLIEHEMEVVMTLADRITVLNFGKVLAEGAPAEIQRNEAVIEAYLGRADREAELHTQVGRAADGTGAPLLEVADLTVRYGDIEAVRKVSLNVGTGEFVALLGNNGAGKSSTLKAIARLAQASGSVRFAGHELTKEPTERLVGMGLALVPERRRLFGGLTVIENLKIGAYGRPHAELARLIEEMLELFPNLKRLSASLAFSLSGGEQQMLAIARALISRPRLLLLDEPSLGLAPLLVEQVFSKLVEVNRQGTAVLLVEQNARMALSVAHRGYVLSSGRIVAEGSAAAVARDPRLMGAYLGHGEAAE